MTFEEIRNTVNAAWRDYVVNGVPATGPNEPVKQEIRAALLKMTVAMENGGFSAPPNWAADLADVQSKLDDVDAVVAGLGTVSAKALEAQAAASAAVAARDDAVAIYGSIEAVEAAAATATDAIDQMLEIAAGSPEAPSVLNKVNRDGSNARGDFLTTVGVASDFLPLTGVEWIENPAWAGILTSRLNDGRLYSIQSARLHYSTDFGESWTPIGPSGVTGGGIANSILPLGDGEALLVTPSTLYKTVGWPSSAFTTKLVFTNPTTSTFLTWGVDTAPSSGLAVATAYQAGDMAGFQQSRYVWLSQDNGEAWSVIRDLDAVGENDQHIHFAVFDPWQDNRIYIGHHNYDNVTGSGKVIEYSDDRGATWTPLDISLTVGEVAIVAQPTTAVATPGGIVFGSDDSVTGLFVLRRGNTKLEYMAEGPAEDFNSTVRSFARHSQIDPETGVVYTCFILQSQGGHGFIMASDWRSGSVVYDDGTYANISSALPGFYHFAFVPQGIVARALRPSTANPAVDTWWIMRAKRAERGSRRFDSGKLEGGSVGAGNVRNTAGGYGSIANGGRSAAYGYKAKAGRSGNNLNAAFGPGADATEDRAAALGGDSKAGVQATAVGSGAIAGTQAVAIGNNAGQEGVHTRLVVVGHEAKARGQSVAIGAGALADVGTQAVTVGEMSSAANFGVAVGKSAAAANTCVAVGHSANAVGEGAAFGYNAKTTGAYGTAVGAGAEAANSGLALGRMAKSQHTNSVALGAGLTTTRADQVLVGAKDVEISAATKGLVLTSPDGSKWRMTISDAGVAAWTKL